MKQSFENTHVRKNTNKFGFYTLIRIFDARIENTHVRKNTNKFGFSLT